MTRHARATAALVPALVPALVSMLAPRLLALLAALAATAAAAPAPTPVPNQAPSDACRDIPAADAAWLAPEADADALRRNRPDAALARACARRTTTPGPATDLELAQALVAASRLDTAAALLRTLPDAPADGAARTIDAEIALARGQHALADGRHADAGPHFERALAIARALALSGRVPVRALTGRASVLQTLRPGADALARADAALDEAAAELQRAGLADAREMGDLLNQRTMLSYARQDLPAAIAHARAEVALVRRLDGPDAPDAFDALASLGAMLSQLGRHDEAEAALRDGLRLMALHPDVSPGAQLGVLNNLAALGLDRACWDDAIHFAEQSLALAERAFPGRAGSKVVAMSHRAQALMGQARLAEAQKRYEEAWALVRDDPSVPALRRLRLLDNLADLHTRLNDAESAQAAIDAGLAITQRDAHFGYWRGRLLRHRATLAATAGRWAEADALHAEATPLIAATIGADHVYTLVSTVQRCLAQVQGRLPGDACAVLRAREAGLADAAAAHRFRVQHALATAADAAGDRAGARRHHLQALAAAQSAATPHPLWVAYDALARHLRAQRPDAPTRAIAVAFGKAAVAQVEAMRRDLSSAARDSERHFLADKHAVYRRLADWLAEDGRIDEALDVLRLLKAEELLDFERRSGAAERRSPGPLLTEREQRWQAQAPRDGVPNATPAPGPTAGSASATTPGAPPAPAPASAAAQEAARVAAWQALIDDAGDAPPGAPVPRRAMAAASRPARGELHAWYFAGPTHLNLVIDGAQGRRLLRQPLAEPLAPRVGRLLSAIGRRDADAQPLLQALHADLAAPLLPAARQERSTRLVLHLDGPLRYLPFAALHDGERPLGARLAVEQRLLPLPEAPGSPTPPTPPQGADAARLIAASTPGATAPLYVRAFGVTRALSGLPALPAVAGEVCAIVDGEVQGLSDGATCARGLLPGAGWLDAAFTPTQLRLAAGAGRPAQAGTGSTSRPPANRGQRHLLHLGTHFVLRPGHIGRSWLLTGDAQRLSLDELAAFELRGQALVTLSACETGLGGAEGADGREVDGLAAVLARRGAGAVIASLWRVDDRSTSALMQALYAALARGATPAAALQQAQQRVREAPGGAWRHPFHWAGFTLLVPAH